MTISKIISMSSVEELGNSHSYVPSISADGRYVAFSSWASNLSEIDNNSTQDVFLRDLQTGATTLISLSSFGIQGSDKSENPSISSGGDYVVFDSLSGNLSLGDENNVRDVFMRNVQSGVTTIISSSSTGIQGNGGSGSADVSSDGRYVVFESSADNLVIGDNNNSSDIFLKDTITGDIVLLSKSSSGEVGNASSQRPSISSDGRYLVFESAASNLVSGDNNNQKDVFLRDNVMGITTLVSKSSAGVQGDSASDWATVSADGRYVAFSSFSSNFSSNDFNGGWDVFLHDVKYGTTTLISKSSSGVSGNGASFGGKISANGDYVSFTSIASNLDDKDLNNSTDIFVYSKQKDSVEIVSLNGGAFISSISDDGRYVAFDSHENDPRLGDSNNLYDVFLNVIDDRIILGDANNNILFNQNVDNKIDGGAGIDTLSYSNASAAISINLSIHAAQDTGGAGIDIILNIENIIGSNYDDTLIGNAAANVLDGGLGADIMAGRNGDDTYYVNHVDDMVSESLAGGIDTLYSSLATCALRANIEKGIVHGAAAGDLTGNNLANTLTGNAARNVLNGSAGDDLLDGKAGNDALIGGAGNDTLIGGAGKDMLTGGEGNDVFKFNTFAESGITSATWDVITDFVRGQDRIDLSVLDANIALAGNQAFTGLIGANVAFSKAGQLKLVAGVLYGNTDSDATAEFAIALTGITTLANTDFVL